MRTREKLFVAIPRKVSGRLVFGTEPPSGAISLIPSRESLRSFGTIRPGQSIEREGEGKMAEKADDVEPE